MIPNYTPKVGDELIAIDPCEMKDGSGDALIVGKSYEILYVDDDVLTIDIDSEITKFHGYYIDMLDKFFKLPEPHESIVVSNLESDHFLRPTNLVFDTSNIKSFVDVVQVLELICPNISLWGGITPKYQTLIDKGILKQQ